MLNNDKEFPSGAYKRNMNEHIASMQHIFPKRFDKDKKRECEYAKSDIAIKFGDFLMNQSDKMELQKVESPDPNFNAFRARVAILSVEELMEFYEYIRRLEKEIEMLNAAFEGLDHE